MEVIWRPTPEVLGQANVVRLMRKLGFDDYRELQRRSAEDPEWFWAAAIEDLGLEFSQPWEKVVDLSNGPEWATWFVGGKVNIAWNCVHRWAERKPGDPAAIANPESGPRRVLNYGQLSRLVTQLGEGLVALGVEPGDRVAIFMPMCPEVAVSVLATAKIGGAAGLPQRSTSRRAWWLLALGCREATDQRIGVRKNHGRSAAVRMCSTSRKSTLRHATSSARPPTSPAKRTASGIAAHTVDRASGTKTSESTIRMAIISA